MKRIVAIASGKGGVGKSTVSVNLAVALAKQATDEGRPPRVALIDCDFYGPSVPTLMGGGEIAQDHEGRLIPANRFGVKYISIAFFVKNPDDPIIWRGPMFGKAINQLFNDVNWGDVDVCIVDMPPGTGDAQLSLSQLIELSGAVMVTTPQEVALTDVRRAINMFRKVNVPVLGVVENMAGFKDSSGNIVNLFGEGGGRTLAKDYQLPFLGSVALDPQICSGGDKGTPIAGLNDSDGAATFKELAKNLLAELEASNESAPVISN